MHDHTEILEGKLVCFNEDNEQINGSWEMVGTETMYRFQFTELMIISLHPTLVHAYSTDLSFFGFGNSV